MLGIVTLAVGLRPAGPSSPAAWPPLRVLVLLGGALVAFVAMERALITRDFTSQYVAENGSSRTPPLYNVATLWSALEGSILLWALVLAGYLRGRGRASSASRLDDPLVGWAHAHDVRRRAPSSSC